MDESMFNALDMSIRPKVRLRDGNVAQAQGKGLVKLQTKEGTRPIHDVLFIPCQAQSLLGIAQMIANGYSISFKDSLCSQMIT